MDFSKGKKVIFEVFRVEDEGDKFVDEGSAEGTTFFGKAASGFYILNKEGMTGLP